MRFESLDFFRKRYCGDVATALLSSRRQCRWTNVGVALVLLSMLALWPLQSAAQVLLSIDDVALPEGSSGTQRFDFTVQLDAPAPPGGVTFDIVSRSGTADGSDFASGQSQFSASIAEGQSRHVFTVDVHGDVEHEVDEVFYVDVSNAVGAEIVDARGTGSILNDDEPPNIEIRDAGILEGDDGVRMLSAEVTLDVPSGLEVRVDYMTNDGRAESPEDYASQSGTLVFAPGETRKTISIGIQGDTEPEADEAFNLSFWNEQNAYLRYYDAQLTIHDDDRPFALDPAVLPDGEIWARYDERISLVGATRPYTLELFSGALPPGLELIVSGSNHYIVGVPTTTGTYAFSIGVRGGLRSQAYTITVELPAQVVLRATPEYLTGMQFQPVTGRIEAIGGAAPFAFAVTGGQLPDGVRLDADGTLSGTPTTHGLYTFTATATESVPVNPRSGSRDFLLRIDAAPVSLAPSSLPSGYLNESYSYVLTAAGGMPPYFFELGSGTLPPGVQLLQGGVHGIPTAEGQYRFTIKVSDNAAPVRSVATVEYVVDIAPRPLGFVPRPAMSVEAGNSFSTTFAVRAGIAPYSFSLVAGTLPAGLDFTSDGMLKGAPLAAGSFDFELQVSDSVGATATQAFRLDVVMPVVTLTSTMPNGQVGNGFSGSVYANGGRQPYVFSVTAGELPPGLQLDPRGFVTGVPTTAGEYTFTLTAADSNLVVGPITGSRTYTVTIEPAGFVFGPSTLPNALTDVWYTQWFEPFQPVHPLQYVVSAGALPQGMFIAGEHLMGAPVEAGMFTFSVTGTDSRGSSSTYTRDYVLYVDLSPIDIEARSLAPATAGRTYSSRISAKGGLRPYRFRVVAGTLPPGISLDDSGYLSGTSTAPGHYSFTVGVTDSAEGTPSTAVRSFGLTVQLPDVIISTQRLEPSSVGSNYISTLRTYGGREPYTYALSAGTLPAGIQLTTDGSLRGIPEVAGSFEITITASDSSTPFGPVSGSRSFTLVVEPRKLSLPDGPLPMAREGIAYTIKLAAANGTAPYRFSVTNGALPPGLELASDGTISGTPGRPAGTWGYHRYDFAVSIVDANGVSATFPHLSITLTRKTLSISPATLTRAMAGTPYSQQFTAANATQPSVFAFDGGTLPAGLRFDAANATLTGTPLESGLFYFRLRLTDAENLSDVTTFSLEVVSPTLMLSPGTLSGIVAGSAYRQVFETSGGIAPYSYALSEDDTLPAGLSLSRYGVLEGVPAVAGAFSFSIVATDSTGNRPAMVAHAYTLEIATPSIAIDPASLPKVIAGLEYAQTFTAAGGVAPYRYEVSAGALPAGLSLTSEGVLAGTATVLGESSFTVRATDALGFAGERAYRIPVTVPKPVPASRTLETVAGAMVTLDLAEGASGGPFTSATLVSLSPSDAAVARILSQGESHLLQFTPGYAYSGRATVTFTLSNATTTSATATISFDVVARPDPSADAESRPLTDAQADATRRFATTQINNFQQRLERLHGAGNGGGFDNGLSVSYDQYCAEMVGSIPGRRCDRPNAGDSIGGGAGNGRGNGLGNGAGEGGGSGNKAFGIWASGTIRSGNHDGRNDSADVDFETDGVSFGLDYRLNEAFVLGGGVGYGTDSSDVGENGSRSKGRAYTFALYGSYSPGDVFFLDGLWGYQNLDYDLRRFVTTNGNFVNGSRGGSQWFGSVSAGADIGAGNWQFTPYARVDVAKARLNGYTESGDAIFALRYEEMEVETTTGNAGVRIDYSRETSWGRFSPQFRVEYQHDFKGGAAQTMRYADLPVGPFYRATFSDFDRSRWMFGLGLLFDLDNDWSFKVDYRGLIGNGDDRDHGVQLNVDKKF